MDSISTLGWIGIILGGVVVFYGLYRFREIIFKSFLPYLFRILGTLIVMALLYGLITLIS
jgi:hypothetical protein